MTITSIMSIPREQTIRDHACFARGCTNKITHRVHLSESPAIEITLMLCPTCMCRVAKDPDEWYKVIGVTGQD